MTIQLLHYYNGLAPSVYTNLGRAEETRLIGLGLARAYKPGMDGRNPVLSNGAQAAAQAIVSKAGLVTSLRAAWLVRVAEMKAQNPIIGNGGFGGANAVRFVNPEHTAFNGDGTSPVAATVGGGVGTFNAMPATALNTTYLICESTSIGPVEIAQDGVMLGTYGRNSTASAIQRVTDPARVATIDGAGGIWGVRSVANKANWGLSGIRVTNIAGSSCDAVQLGAQTTSVVSANCFAEYVYVDNVTGVAGNGVGIISRGTQAIIRFCGVRIAEGEPIYCGDNGSGAPGDNPQVYGNDLEIVSTTGDGPDGIQIVNQISSTLSKSIRIEANWINVSNTNCKYGIIATHTPNPESVLIAYNVIECADVSANPYVTGATGAGVHQGGIYCTVVTSVPQGVRIFVNAVLGGENSIDYAPVAAGGSAAIRGNLCYQFGAGRSSGYRPIGIYLRTNTTVVSRVEHNTLVIDFDSGTDSRGIFSAANGAAHQYNANVVVGPWKWGVQKGSATTESYNSAFGAVLANFADSTGALVAPGAGSSEVNPALLNGSFYPEGLEPTVPASIRALPIDVFGQPYRGLAGAVQ